MRNILLSVVAAAGLMGCVGGIDTPPSVDPPADGVGGGGTGTAAIEARKLFEDTVHPVLEKKCIGCHNADVPSGATGFVATAKADAYVTAVGYQAVVGDWTPTGAPILAKLNGGHQGQSYTDDEKSKITAWLAKELESRAGGGGTPPPGAETPAAITERLTKEWSGCMTAANFATANMKAWGNMRAGNSACKTCHGSGEFGFIALDTDPQFFEAISTDKYYMAQYFSADPKANKMIINTRSFNGVRQGLVPHLEHPRFTLDGSTGLVALQKFYDLTMAAKTAGTCGTPTLKN